MMRRSFNRRLPLVALCLGLCALLWAGSASAQRSCPPDFVIGNPPGNGVPDFSGAVPYLKTTVAGPFKAYWYEQTDPAYANDTYEVYPEDLVPFAVVNDVLAGLISSRAKLISYFLEYPYILGCDKINVVFYDLSGNKKGGTAIFHNSLLLDAPHLTASPALRKTVPAHELFHRFEYSFGYLVYPNYATDKWFTEGMAEWASLYATGILPSTGLYSLWPMVANRDLYNEPAAAYDAVSFWDHLHRRGVDLRVFMDDYQATGSLEHALETALLDAFGGNGVFADPYDFFALWHRNHVTHEFGPVGITDVNGVAYAAQLPTALLADVALNGQPVQMAGTVAARGAVYHQLSITANSLTLGHKLHVKVQAQPGDSVNMQFIAQECTPGGLDCTMQLASFPFFEHQNFTHAYEIDGAWSDMFVVVSGRDSEAAYTLEAWID